MSLFEIECTSQGISCEFTFRPRTINIIYGQDSPFTDRYTPLITHGQIPEGCTVIAPHINTAINLGRTIFLYEPGIETLGGQIVKIGGIGVVKICDTEPGKFCVGEIDSQTVYEAHQVAGIQLGYIIFGGTTKISSDGRVINDPDQTQLGAYMVEEDSIPKVTNTMFIKTFKNPPFLSPNVLFAWQYEDSQLGGICYSEPQNWTLKEIIENAPHDFDYHDLLPSLRKLGYSIGFLHRKIGVVHRQLHLNNYGFTPEEEIFIGDFETIERLDGYDTKMVVEGLEVTPLESAIMHDISKLIRTVFNSFYKMDVDITSEDYPQQLKIACEAVSNVLAGYLETKDPERTARQLFVPIKEEVTKYNSSFYLTPIWARNYESYDPFIPVQIVMQRALKTAPDFTEYYKFLERKGIKTKPREEKIKFWKSLQRIK